MIVRYFCVTQSSVWFVFLSGFYVLVETTFCPTTGYPDEPGKVPISVWAKPSKSGSDIYRLGSAELLTEGYRRGTRDDDAVVVILNRGPPRACSNSCASKLIVNERINDGVILHQINTSVPPPGYKSVDGASSLYCVLNEGDCGADAPLFIFRKRSPINTAYAYSVDPNVSIAGFEKEAKPLCYGWSDRGKRADGVLSNVLKQLDGCGPISGVVNGQVIYESASNVNFPVGSTATVHCRNGFTVVGPTSLTCTHFGWYPESVLGNCAVENDAPISHCESFPTPQNGQIIYNSQRSGVHPSGTIAILQCDIGFRATSTTLEAKCENGLWSTPNLGPCEQSTSRCSQLPSVLNGQIEYITDKNGQLGVGATAKLRCIAGYQIAGSNFVTCTTSGWIPFTGIGTCHLKSIDNAVRTKRQSNVQCVTGMPVVLNGQISYSQGGLFGPFPSGTLATLTCNAGFIVSGQSTASCSGQSWQPSSFGTCSRDPGDGSGAHCPFGLGPPIGGTISYSKGAPFGPFPAGTTATLQCTSGSPQGSTSSQCANGQWSPNTLGTCSASSGIGACLVGLPTPPNGRLTYSTGSTVGPFSSGTNVTVSCDLGFTPSGTTTANCSNGQWSPSAVAHCIKADSTAVEAVEMQCSSAISTPANGQVTYSEGRSIAPFPSGTMAMLTCSLGNQPSGEITSRCDNGQWRPSTFSPCTRSASGAAQCVFGIGPPVNGRVHYSNGALLGPFPSGTSAGVVCNSGFAPTGTTPSVCQNGQWSSTALGQCTRGGGSGVTQCPTGPGTVFNGQINYSNGAIFGPFPSGVTATLSCNSGFSPSGGLTTSTCQNGIWSPSSLAQCVVGGSGSDGAQCFSGLATPPNGQISYSNGMQFGPFPSNTAATLTCLFGFSPSGQTTSICTNGVWNPPTMSQCIQGMTGSCLTGLFPPLNGRMIYSNGAATGPFPSGTTVTVVCNPGFTATGSTSATCLNGQFTPSPLAQCMQSRTGGIGSPGQCFALMPPFNGQISYSQQSSSSTYPTGTIATLMCGLGFTVSGGATATTCINGQWNPSTLGTCQAGIGGSGSGASTTGQCLFALPSVSNGNIQYSSGSSIGPFNSGTSASLTCNSGSTLMGPMTSFCSYGVWQPSSLGPCSSTNGVTDVGSGVSGRQCYILPAVLEGELSYSGVSTAGVYRQGTVVTLTCKPGYSVSGPAAAICSASGWNPWPSVGSCERIETPRSPTAFTGSVLTYCPAQVPPLNGNINYNEVPTVGSYPAGTVAKLQCNLGFTASGSSISVCRDGVWNPQLGVCQAGVGSFSGPGSCTSLSVPRNGKIFYIQAGAQSTNELGTTAILTCDAGFVAVGQTTLTCTASGWMPQSGFGPCQSGN
ncbi:Sushi, von Willebrand factor type A, EGF and pentraxin domain-containing protein 1 [Toxocara canis]|uniref:Sushi, von Willebrand factor type A, EGF and pentraxin domain-containing protein 1 n=1 Tax=Toxocara canis TaxID=6265 RepID=A0A0B2V8B9_TOXCA|nr:Sushi, von Willebrand factor type A, EGF and pentraxin domain-containing protein 1 [Toxocara canis]